MPSWMRQTAGAGAHKKHHNHRRTSRSSLLSPTRLKAAWLSRNAYQPTQQVDSQTLGLRSHVPTPYYILDSPQGDPSEAHSALSLLVRLPCTAASWLHVRVASQKDPTDAKMHSTENPKVVHTHSLHASSPTSSFATRRQRRSSQDPNALHSSHRHSGSFSSLMLLTRKSGRFRQKDLRHSQNIGRSVGKSKPLRLFRSGSAPDLSDVAILDHHSSNGHSVVHMKNDSPSQHQTPTSGSGSGCSPCHSQSQSHSQFLSPPQALSLSLSHSHSHSHSQSQSPAKSFAHTSSSSRHLRLHRKVHPEAWTLCWAELRAGYILLMRYVSEPNNRKLRKRRHAKEKSNSFHPSNAFTSIENDGDDNNPTQGYATESLTNQRVDFVFDTTKSTVRVRDDRRGDGVRVCIEAASHAELVLRFASRAEADPWLWALSTTVSPYEGIPLDTFRVTSPLGAGAFGKVYLVRDVRTNERLALKVLEKSTVFQDQLHFESAVNERLTLELVCGQPFLARLRYATQTARYLYLVTDFYEGGDLFNFLRNHHESLMEAHAIRVIAEVVLALEAMHSLHLVYRDLKPENVLLDSDGHVRLADLGLAKKLDSQSNYLTRTVCGSLVYAGPEMLAGEYYGISFDMWTLGIFIYQVLTGELPFVTDDVPVSDILAEQLRGNIPRGVLSDDAYSVVCQLLSCNADRRPSCRQLRSHPFFSSINWDDLENKREHEFSLTQIMHEKAESKRAGIQTDRELQGEEERLDEFLLRNFDPDEWTDMSFSDVSDGESYADVFRSLFTCDTTGAEETKLLPGWNFYNRSGNWRRHCYRKPSPSAVEDGTNRRDRSSELWSSLRSSRRNSQKSVS